MRNSRAGLRRRCFCKPTQIIVLCSAAIVLHVLSNIAFVSWREDATGEHDGARYPMALSEHDYSMDVSKLVSTDAVPKTTSQESKEVINVTKLADRETVFFNRLAKVGSTTMIYLILNLAARNHFAKGKFKGYIFQQRPRTTESEQRVLCSELASAKVPGTYIEHLLFLNFTQFNLPMPIYMNMVRDPVEQAISLYYFVRSEMAKPLRGRLRKPFDPKMGNLTDLNECVLSGDPMCQYDGDVLRRPGSLLGCITCFFCGMGDDCITFNSRHVMQKAKDHVERYYAVVGVLEHWDMSLSVLEAYIPRFFAGARATYKRFGAGKSNENKHKLPVMDQVKELMRKNFTHEIEFYEFCKQRLFLQHQAVNSN